MGRKAREFSPAEVKDMVALFEAGETTEGIGVVYNCSGQLIGRVLTPILGDLRTARSIAKIHGSIARERAEHKDYREGFHAGCLMALTWVNLHGMEATRDYCDNTLLPWRENGLQNPPGFLRSP